MHTSITVGRLAAAALFAALALIIGISTAFADTASSNFESPAYSVGDINGQDGWVKTGSFDVAVVDNTYGIGTFGSQTLRISNAVTSGSFGDQTFSKPLADEAGETDALNGGMSGGTRQNHFEAQFDLASASTSLQSGLSISVSPDRGDGARMSYLRFEDSAAGIDVFFDDVQGATDPANFVETEIASDLSRSAHTIKFSMDFVDGPGNDVVEIYIDGTLVHTGTSWENYYRFDDESNPGLAQNNSRTVDSLLFRTAGTAVPANSGGGFLVDNISLLSSTPATSTPTVKVTINKFIDGQMATSGSATGSAFPMEATWNATNIGAGSGSYDLDADGFNGDPTPYQAITSQMTSGADYSTNEVVGGSVVGATCADGKPFALSGYSSGDTLALAQAATTSSSSPALTNITSDKYVIVWNVTCTATSTPPTATTSQVTIVKYVNGEHATAANATSTTFPFTATYDASNIGAGSDPFTIGPVGNGTPNSYEAMTIPLANGAMYNATENTSGNDVVGASCADGKPFALSGYSIGDTLALAQSASTSSTSPTFNDLQSDKYVIVWNVACAGTTTPPVSTVPPANACNTPSSAPAGYTLKNGTSGHDKVVLAPNTMFVGHGGNDKVSGDAGNYIVCLGSGNDKVVLGDGNSTIDAGAGNNKVTTGNGEGTILAAGGNDTVVVGDGARTIDVGNGNNKVTSGDAAQSIMTGSGNDKIWAGSGDDTLDAGGGNNKVWGEDGADMLTSGAGNDKLDGGNGTDTCQADGGNNANTSCEL